MTDLVIDVGTARLAATDLRPSADERGTVVALHAGVADRRSWHACASDWVADGWRVVSYDRRGFGGSTWEEHDHDDVADLWAVVDAVGAGPVVLVGNSRGGALALDATVADPDRVRGVVVVGSTASGQPWEPGRATEAEESIGAQIEAADEAGDVDEVNRLECHFWLDGPDQPEGRVTGPARDLFLAMNGRALTAPPVGVRAEPVPAWDRLATLAVPVAVIVGGLDERDSVVMGGELAAHVPGARLVTMARSAHLPMLDAPTEFTASVTDFLAGLA